MRLFPESTSTYRARDTSIEGPRQIRLHKSILNELGYDLQSASVILDFGCGEGERVHQYRIAGYNAFGVDIKLRAETNYLGLIETTRGYRIPFSDGSFDFVFSESVLEHVHDYPNAVAEIWRVLKPGGVSLHFFPPKWKPIEPHVFVPLGGVMQNYVWTLTWAFLGIRNSFQKDLRFKEVADRNYDYLKNNTHYLPARKIREHILAHFPNVISAEKYLIRHSYGRARYLNPLITVFPLIVSLYRLFHWRVLFFSKQQSLQ